MNPQWDARAIQLATIVALVGMYEGVARSGVIYKGVVPPLGAIAGAFVKIVIDPTFYRHFAVTAYEVAVGFAIALVIGVAAGILLGAKQLVGDVAAPFVDGLATAPKIIFFPIAMLLLGVGPPSKIALGALSAFFPIVLSVAAAARQMNPVLIRVGRSFNISQPQMVRKIYLPQLVPAIVTGVRLGLGLAIIGVLLGEVKLSDRGLGFLTIDHYNHSRIPQMYAMLLVVFIVAVGANAVMSRLNVSTK